LERLYNERSKDVNRPGLEAAYRYDTKVAMHLIRFHGEAQELVERGEITLPRPNAADLIQIRLGKYKLSGVIELGKVLQQEDSEAKSCSPLPAKADKEAVSRLIAQVYLDFWKAGSS
jgi:hypothetical protein